MRFALKPVSASTTAVLPTAPKASGVSFLDALVGALDQATQSPNLSVIHSQVRSNSSIDTDDQGLAENAQSNTPQIETSPASQMRADQTAVISALNANGEKQVSDAKPSESSASSCEPEQSKTAQMKPKTAQPEVSQGSDSDDKTVNQNASHQLVVQLPVIVVEFYSSQSDAKPNTTSLRPVDPPEASTGPKNLPDSTATIQHVVDNQATPQFPSNNSADGPKVYDSLSVPPPNSAAAVIAAQCASISKSVDLTSSTQKATQSKNANSTPGAGSTDTSSRDIASALRNSVSQDSNTAQHSVSNPAAAGIAAQYPSISRNGELTVSMEKAAQSKNAASTPGADSTDTYSKDAANALRNSVSQDSNTAHHSIPNPAAAGIAVQSASTSKSAELAFSTDKAAPSESPASAPGADSTDTYSKDAANAFGSSASQVSNTTQRPVPNLAAAGIAVKYASISKSGELTFSTETVAPSRNAASTPSADSTGTRSNDIASASRDSASQDLHTTERSVSNFAAAGIAAQSASISVTTELALSTGKVAPSKNEALTPGTDSTDKFSTGIANALKSSASQDSNTTQHSIPNPAAAGIATQSASISKSAELIFSVDKPTQSKNAGATLVVNQTDAGSKDSANAAKSGASQDSNTAQHPVPIGSQPSENVQPTHPQDTNVPAKSIEIASTQAITSMAQPSSALPSDSRATTSPRTEAPIHNQDLWALPLEHSEAMGVLGSAGINTARLIQTISASEMSLGMHSAEFGDIAIRTSVSQQQVQGQINVDHSALGIAIAAHLPSLQSKLGNELGLHTSIEVNQLGGSLAGGHGQSAQQYQRSISHPAFAEDASQGNEAELLPAVSLLSTEDCRLDIRI